uniref:Uncharacterized protein n=1 Tax=Peronospora matthiolae TaxID=2874970 RepID=A0AAV1VEM5_9STRA
MNIPSNDLGNFHAISKFGRWEMAILMARPALRVEENLCVTAQITLRNGPGALDRFRWTPISPGVVSGERLDPHCRNHASNIIQQKRNDVHWESDQMVGLPSDSAHD